MALRDSLFTYFSIPVSFPSSSSVEGSQELWFHGCEAKMEFRLELRFQQTVEQEHPGQKVQGLKNEET